ncbi:MAG: restriction endonuclease [Chloroflexi bacterium]|nr:restriction endonuclease [Chloroflexota bacterium]
MVSSEEKMSKKELKACRKEKARKAIFVHERPVLLLEELIRLHFRALNTKWHQLIIQDDYGNFEYGGFIKELEYFYENVFISEVTKKRIDLSVNPIDLERFISLFLSIFEKLKNESDNTFAYIVQETTPVEFEIKCADVLISLGWTARITKGTGDQGVDVIAEKNGVKAVLQCKKYSNPVGNKAVQEVYAGKQHELADIAAVVTNSTFTKSAQELANTCDVLLLHVSEIGFIDDIVNDDCEKNSGEESNYDSIILQLEICGYHVEIINEQNLNILRAFEDDVPVFHVTETGSGDIQICTMNYEIGSFLGNCKEKLYAMLSNANNQLNVSKVVTDENGFVTMSVWYFGKYDDDSFRSFVLMAKEDRKIFLGYDLEKLSYAGAEGT